MKSHHILLAALAITLCSTARADAFDAQPSIRLSGFGTLGAGYHGTDGIEYRRDLEQARGYEGGKLGMRGDTRLGVQANVELDKQWGAMVQAVSRMNRSGDWAPEVSWAFVRYSPTDWLDLRAGRLGLDIYQHGDSRHVGYAYTAARPAPEVYGMLTEDRFDGVDLTLNRHLGSGIMSFKLYGGRNRGGYYLYGRDIANDSPTSLGASLQWTGEALSIKASWGSSYTRKDPSLLPLADALRSVPSFLAPDAAARADEIGNSHHVNFAGLSALYEHQGIRLEGTLGWERFTAFPGFEGWIGTVLAAYRTGAWTPYAGYSRNVFSPKSKPLAIAPLNPALQELQRVYDQVTDRLHMDQRTLTAGVRYDFGGNYALKVQVDHTDAAASTLLIDRQGMPVHDKSLTLYSIVLDFVF